ncbi:T9SS type B sorting domain-containing protein [Flavobacterium sp. Sr18]|uniref:T9SS type B sorting domain-containing protein n=1 Tax=Flavobacterium sp. Sr18 TaxID=935222 RepID=UPI0013E524A2|nr:T9SS type B sorting domain-containing protein [Flavobacterium sp. Sr18]QIH39003.1 T9SS type B sorting domain-containing protein [Flavobacterium sp. Sr18]
MKKTTFLKRVSLVNTAIIFIKSFLLSRKDATPVIANAKQVQRGFALQLILLFAFSILIGQTSYGQIGKVFDARLNDGNGNKYLKVKGDVLLIGNTVINKVGAKDANTNPAIFSPAAPVNGVAYTGSVTNLAALTTEANLPFNTVGDNNNSFFVEYIDIDTDNSTFSSSTANLLINNSCKKIVFAGLYWSAIYPYDRSTNSGAKYEGSLRDQNFDKIKFKIPNATSYLDLVADQIIFDGYKYNGPNVSNSFKDSPYVCFKDVTSLVANLTDADGEYTVGNVRAARGKRDGGSAGGWTLVVVYESPTVPSKFISIFDGYVGVNPDVNTPGYLPSVDFQISGFKTLPAPFPVNAKIGVAALEGDGGGNGDTFQFKALTVPTLFTAISDARNPANNFFNATISNEGSHILNRLPKSTNTLGFDIDNVIVPNALNAVVPNGETGATLRLTTTGDGYGAFVTTFAVDIIEPTILLTKEVFDDKGADASNANVILGQQLNYVIGFENQGNDDATGFTIKDILPKNVDFIYPDDIDGTSLPTGVTHSYNAITRTLIFNIPDALVIKNLTPGPPFVRSAIRFKVKVAPNCNALVDRCNNVIKNSAYATYKGVVNPTQITDDPSISKFTTCNLGSPQPTNFLVGVNDCLFTQSQILCQATKILTGPAGYASYSWTGPFGFTATTETVTVTQPGVYKVYAVGNAPCTDYKEDFTVSPFGGTVVNPIIAFADNKNPDGTITVCPNNGKALPKIFLCGLDDSRSITTGITGTSSIVWETTTCPAIPANLSDLCANEDLSCTWTSAGPNGPNFLANAAGQYRVTINYDGGCFNRFYFNVYQNTLKPKVDATDIICTTPGKIIVNDVPSTGYEYSIDGTNYQSSNTFSITTENAYKVYIRQTGIVGKACIFEVKNINIRQRNFTVTANASQPRCYGDKGDVLVVANDVEPQYKFNIYVTGGTIPINTSGLKLDNKHTFDDLSPGSYDVEAITENGCSGKQTIVINAVTPLSAKVNITKPITCNDGELTVTPEGGTSPYYYSIDGAPFVTNNVFPIPSPGGTYSIRVVDKNNCSYTIPNITINANPKPIYTVAGTNILCYGSNSGEIKFNVTNANGYTLAYSIDNGATPYVTNGTFSSLAPGTYTPVLRYTLSGVDCFETKPAITITQPAEAVTASMGVSELAGCGVAPNKNYGKVRITNPQGGVAPYEYNFNNPTNPSDWTLVNDAYKAPGTYTLYVRDANKCIFSAPVTIEVEPAAPEIKVDTPVDFNCDGTATSTVTVANPGGSTYTYNYYMDGSANIPITNNVFTNVKPGPHAVKVEYKLNAVPTFSNLLFENFGYGEDTESPGINTTFYCFERQVAAFKCKSSIVIEDGDYSVTARIVQPYVGAWVQPGDHTPQTVPPTAKGRCLVVNLGNKISTTDVIYKKVINDIIPNQPINFELYAKNLLVKGNGQINASLAVALVDATGNEISTFTTGDIPKTELWEKYPKTPITLNPGNNTTLTFIIRSNKSNTNGNDVAIDDIRVYQLPKTCFSTEDFTVVVPTGKAFTAQITGTKNVTCNGLKNGEITISATNFDAVTGYQYSLDNGTNWSIALTTSPHKISGLDPNTYTVAIRPVGSTVTACTQKFPPVTITQPDLIVVNATKTAATCTTGAKITTVATGGTPAYQYELRQVIALVESATPVVAFNNNPAFTNIGTGDYRIYVKDANGCATTVGFPITITAPPAITAAIVPSTALCFDPSTGAQITVNISGGLAPYSYQTQLNGGTFSGSSATFTGPTFTHNAAVTGSYVFRVTDSNGCPAETMQQVINDKLTANAPVTTDLDCDPAPNDKAVISGTIFGGTAPFNVLLTSGQTTGTLAGPVGNSASFTYTTGDSGVYQFQITDAIGCITNTSATINAKVAVTGNAIVTNETCETLNNGSVTLQALTGVAPFTYSFNGILPFTNTVTYGSLSGSVGGTSYPYQIRDNKGCIFNGTATVFEPTPITVTANVSTPYTCTSNATITATASQGNGGYTYVLTRGATTVASNTTGVFPNLSVAGSYTVTVTDAKGCSITSTPAMVIAALTPPTAMTFTYTAVTCTANKTAITIDSVTGGSLPLEYRIIAPASAATTTYQTSATFTNLDPGVTYRFEVRDAKNCMFATNYSVPVLPTLTASGVVVNNVTCFGDSDGSVRYTVGGFVNNTPYFYTIDGVLLATTGTSPATGTTFDILAPGLAAGAHVLLITNDNTKCTTTASVTVAAPSAALAITPPTISPITCTALTASITINTTGGWGSNSYTVTGTVPVVAPVNQTTRTFNNLAAGDYTATVTDVGGCSRSINFTIASYTALEVTPTVTAACSVAGNTNEIVATATGGSGTYTYSINTGVAPTGTLSNTFNVAPGNYTITVRDAFGCIDTETVTVSEVLTATAVRTKDITCSPSQEATIRVTIFGGRAPFSYRVNINALGYGAPTTSAVTTFNYTDTGITTGKSYQFEITDANGCIRVTNIVNTNTPTAVNATATVTNLTCFQSGNGAVTINPIAGLAPFEYSFNGSAFSSISSYSNLAASPVTGYPYIVRDSKGCEFPGFAIVNQPLEIDYMVSKVDMKCDLDIKLGSITVSAITNGVGTINYVLRNLTTGAVVTHSDPSGATSYTFDNLSFGNFELVVTDSRGCSKSVSNIQVLPPPDLLVINTATTADCTNGATIFVEVIPALAPTTPDYYFGIYDQTTAPFTTNLLPPDSTDPLKRTFTNLTPGVVYTFVVYDKNTDCYYFQTATGAVTPATPLTSNIIVENNVTCTGTATGSVTFTLDNYTSTTVNYEIFRNQTNVSTGITGSVVTAAPSTITSPAGLTPGQYYITFTEVGGTNNGCTSASAVFTITESPVLLDLNVTATKNDNCNVNAGEIVAIANGGTAPYRFILNASISAPAANDPLWDSPSTFNVQSGSYYVWVKDSNGCIIGDPVNVLLDPSPVIDLTVLDVCAVEGAFAVDVTLTSPGVGPYKISVNGGDYEDVISFPYPVIGLSSGPQTIVVIDANGCTSNSATVTLTKKLSVIAERTKELDCTTSPDGLITVTVSDGLFTSSDTTPDFRYEVSINGAPYLAPVNFANDVRSFTYTVTTAGTYQFRITDLNNCTVESTVVDIAAKVNPAATATVTQPTCVGVADGAIKITATGGVLPYEYSIDGGTIWQDSNEFTGLAAGTVNYIVRDAKLCEFTDSETIVNPTPVVASASALAFTCSPTNTLNATVVTVTASGGAGTVLADYTFSRDNVNWSSTNTFDVIDKGATQNLTFFAKDANGCVGSVPITIAPFPKLVSAVASLGTQADCNTPTEIINVVVSGGALPNDFKYEVSIDGTAYVLVNPSTGNTISYPATSIGSFYEFKITDNTTGCSIISNAYTVPVFNTMTVTASAAANVDCATNATGAIEINIGNYTGPYNYTIWLGGVATAFTGSGNTSTNPFVLPHGLVAGNNYTVVIAQTAYPSCTVTSNLVAITEPLALDLTNLIVNVKNQNCNTTGAVLTVDDTTIVGGTPGFEFAFVPTGTSPIGFYSPSKTKTIATSATAVSPDLIDVYVKDANGCFRFITKPISLDPVPTVTASAASQCASATGYTINASGAGGVGLLEYSLDGNSFGTSSSLSVTSPGDYDVFVRDANGCINQTAVPVKIFEPLQLLAEITTLSTCLNPDGVVTLTASKGSAIVANYEYSDDGTTYGSSNMFSGLQARIAPYTFYVRDIATGCVKSADVIMLLPNTDIDFVLDPTDVTCNGGSDGTITVNMATPTLIVNNNPIYTYSLTGTTTGGVAVTIPATGTQPSPLFSGLAAGSYTVTVTSGRLCSESDIINVTQPDPILVPAIVPVQFGCTTDNTGNLATITVTGVSGGSGTYLNYEFIKVGTPTNTQVQFGASNVYTEGDLTGGSYIVNVYDDKGCEGTTTTAIIINPYVQLDKVVVDVTRPITCTPKTEDITVSATTIGTGAADLEYTVVDIDASTGIQGGLYPKQTNKTGIFTDLPVGNYFITVKNLLTNCEIIGVHYVNNPETFDLTIDNVVAVTCLNDTSGSARVTLIDRVPSPVDNAGPFDYTVYNITNPLTPVVVIPMTSSLTFGPIPLNGLPAGTFMITATLTNTPFCTVSKNFTIGGPNEALVIDKTHTEITCVAGNNDGSISATATGGWPGGYEFRLEETLAGTVVSDWSTTSTFIGLTAGNYVVKVRDSKGCEVFTTVVLNNPTPIAFTTTTTNATLLCKGDTNASITVVLPVTGGQGTNYLYTLNTTSATPMISSGPQADPVFTNLGAGTYTVTVTDGWGCGTTSTTPIEIREPLAVVTNLVVATAQTCDILSSTTLSATGGTGTYTYSADGTFTPSSNVLLFGTFATATTIPNVPVGTYRYFVRDANGCVSVVSNDITIDKIPDLVIDVNRQNAVINCKGDRSGVIVATAQGGLGNYVYTLLDGAGNALSFTPVQTSPGNFTNLPAGSYLVNVVSMDCEARTVVPVIITEPDFPLTESHAVTNITCAGEGDGKIVITASGGTGIIKYAISPDLNQFFESNIFDNLKPGSYDYIVQDENGCYIYTTGVVITEPNSIIVTTIPGTEIPEVCAGDADGAFSINITGGSAPYSVSLDDVNGTYTLGIVGQTQFDFANLSGSEHIVYVRDTNNCTSEHTVILGEAVTLNPKATVNYDCVNNSASNSVTVTVDASNLPADLDYALDGSTTFQASNVFTNLTAGRHTIDVRHTNGCIKQVVFDVLQVDPLTLTLADGGLNEIVATATGGGGNYQYTLDGESYGNKSNFIIYKSGDYTVTVTDVNGCTATATRYFEFIDIKIPNVFTPNGDGNNDTWAPTNTINYKDLVYDVFDRYGRKLGSYREGQFWDGKYNGTELPSGDYWYVIKIRDVKDAREFVGHFTLYR